ncbi:hypothetical protein M1O19_03180 [Dehalococcoidia bacterium]|nr:hypothetical protein [Dehalococcoidia bacterium]MCL0076268.1 hypothetical protein [Dehalococcoidia bacterium]MCL0094224.1 hypothetical protein [Dehalococcoidia bacterium]MCL0097512.1 hypothetical protein [Dehalococcoidia bacterium]
MATLTHDAEYPCAFDLRLLEWERYDTEKRDADIETVSLGEPYTLWVKYRMALSVGDNVLYQSVKDTTLILEDIRGLIEELRQLADGKKHRMAFDPIEPDFGLWICRLTESNASVKISSAAQIRAGLPTHATNQSTAPSTLFDVNVWIDHPNQVDRVYGGYGPGLYFSVEALDIERFASQLETELDGLGPYFFRGVSEGESP